MIILLFRLIAWIFLVSLHVNYDNNINYSESFWIRAWALALSIPNSLSSLFFSSKDALTNFSSLLFSASCSSYNIFNIYVFCLSTNKFISCWSCSWLFFTGFSLYVFVSTFLFYFLGTTDIVLVLFSVFCVLLYSVWVWFWGLIWTFSVLVIDTFWVVSIEILFRS